MGTIEGGVAITKDTEPKTKSHATTHVQVCVYLRFEFACAIIYIRVFILITFKTQTLATHAAESSFVRICTARFSALYEYCSPKCNQTSLSSGGVFVYVSACMRVPASTLGWQQLATECMRPTL